jgi:hypothetical protein
MRTHYVDYDRRHVHELSLSGGRWQDADLTAITGGPLAREGEAFGVASDPVWNVMRTHYVATDNHVHELCLCGGSWQDADLTAITGGPSVGDFSAIAIVFDPVWSGVRTHYYGTDRHVHELFLNPGGLWQDADLTLLARGPASWGNLRIAYDPVQNTVRTIYVVSNAGIAHVHELSLSGVQWRDADLTAMTGGPTVSGLGDIAFDQHSRTMRVHYYGNDRHVHELSLSGGRWQDADLTAMTGGPWAGAALAMAFDPVWNSVRTHYVAIDNHVHELFLVP